MTARRTSRRRLAHLAAVAVVAGVGLIAVSPAMGYTWVSHGTPGWVQNPSPVAINTLYSHSIPTSGPYSIPIRNTWVQHVRATVVTRSPATTGAQAVLVVHNLERWNGQGWTLQLSRRETATIPRGVQRVTVRGAQWVLPLARGTYRVQSGVAWGVLNGRGLGAVAAYPNRTSEHQCGDAANRCVAGPGWFRYEGNA